MKVLESVLSEWEKEMIKKVEREKEKSRVEIHSFVYRNFMSTTTRLTQVRNRTPSSWCLYVQKPRVAMVFFFSMREMVEIARLFQLLCERWLNFIGPLFLGLLFTIV